MTTQSATGIDVGGRVIILGDLEAELIAGGVAVPNGLTIIGPPVTITKFPPPPYPPLPTGTRLLTVDDNGHAADLPPEAEPIVAAYSPTIPT